MDDKWQEMTSRQIENGNLVKLFYKNGGGRRRYRLEFYDCRRKKEGGQFVGELKLIKEVETPEEADLTHIHEEQASPRRKNILRGIAAAICTVAMGMYYLAVREESTAYLAGSCLTAAVAGGFAVATDDPGEREVRAFNRMIKEARLGVVYGPNFVYYKR